MPTAAFYCAECGDPITGRPAGEIAGSYDVVCRHCWSLEVAD
jgi:DNA-directed RNA polymerase subunit RPC12/RpoP